MWVARTPEEVKKWHQSTKRDARLDGWILGGGCWLGLTALLAGGLIVGGRSGIVAQDSVGGGSFWMRFPPFALGMVPFGYWLYRREVAEKIARALQMTICPKCDTAGELNAGVACSCGGTFVLQSTVRWEDAPTPSPDNSGEAK